MKIVISGTTGVGKSTTVSLLKKTLERKGYKVKVVGELVADSPYFDLYFNNLSEWGFIAQLDFLMERYKQLAEADILEKQDPDLVIIFDRHFLEDKIFADLYWVRQNVSAFQSNIYKTVWDELISKIEMFGSIEFFFLLKADFDIVQQRMKKRGRTQEEKFHIKYWKDLYWKYYSTSKYRKNFKENSTQFVEILTDDKDPDSVVESISKYIFKRNKK